MKKLNISNSSEKLKAGVKGLSIRWKVMISILAFTVAISLMLWLFQIVFFEGVYKYVRMNVIEDSATTLSESLDSKHLIDTIKELSLENDICVRVVGEDGIDVCSYEHIVDCAVHRLGPSEIQDCYAEAVENGGSFTRSMSVKHFFNGAYDSNDAKSEDNIVYVKLIVEPESGKQYMILIGSTLSPLTTTEKTIKYEFYYIGAGLIIMIIILTLVLSRFVTRPIARLNADAKQLAAGDYDVEFNGKGYVEIEELSSTLNYATNELKKVERLRNELIANISHDLRTPLTLISGYGEVMRDIPGENNEENIQVIIDESNHLTEIVNELMDLSKLKSGQHMLNLEEINISEFLTQIVSRYDKFNGLDGYKIELEKDSESVFVSADHIQLGRVISNLINNAINYTGEDRRVAVRQIIKRSNISGDIEVVRIEVSDSGKGIPPEDIPHIWDRYYRSGDKHQRAKVGSGLGLSIVKVILDLHGAKYGVISSPHGSTFWFEVNRIYV